MVLISPNNSRSNPESTATPTTTDLLEIKMLEPNSPDSIRHDEKSSVLTHAPPT
jgi:hypothetical protein